MHPGTLWSFFSLLLRWHDPCKLNVSGLYVGEVPYHVFVACVQAGNGSIFLESSREVAFRGEDGSSSHKSAREFLVTVYKLPDLGLSHLHSSQVPSRLAGGTVAHHTSSLLCISVESNPMAFLLASCRPGFYPFHVLLCRNVLE